MKRNDKTKKVIHENLENKKFILVNFNTLINPQNLNIPKVSRVW